MGKIGDNIMRRRKALGMTQEELANRMGYKSKSTINKIELGINDIPQSRVSKFADVLGVSVAEIMGWNEMQQKNDIRSDIAVRLIKDSEFLSVVEVINQLNPEQLASIKQVANVLLKS